MNKIKRAKQKRIASGLRLRFRDWWFGRVKEHQLEQQND